MPRGYGQNMDYFGLPCALVHFSAFEYSIKGEASVLVYRREGIEIQMPVSNS